MINMTNKLMYQLETLNAQNSKVTYQMSSGKELEHGSDNSNLFDYTLSIENDIRTYEGIEKQIDLALVYNTTSDSTLSEFKNQMDVVETTVQTALNDTVDQATRSSMAENLRDTKDTMVTMLNEQANGSYVYSGSDGTVEPFVVDSNGKVNYMGGTDYKKVPVDEGVYKEQGLNGFDVAFYTTSKANTGETLEFTDAERLIDDEGNEWVFIDHDLDGVIDKDRIYKNGDDTSTYLDVIQTDDTPVVYEAVNTQDESIEAKHNYFDDLDAIINALEMKDANGNPIPEHEADAILSESLEKQTMAFDSVNSNHAILGGKNATFESYSYTTSAKITNYEIMLEDFSSADLTKAAIEAQSLELTYSALYSTIAKVNELSLVNYV